MKLSELLRLYRTHLGLSLRQMAKRIGVDHSALFRFENGKPIEQETITKIALYLLTP